MCESAGHTECCSCRFACSFYYYPIKNEYYNVFSMRVSNRKLLTRDKLLFPRRHGRSVSISLSHTGKISGGPSCLQQSSTWMIRFEQSSSSLNPSSAEPTLFAASRHTSTSCPPLSIRPPWIFVVFPPGGEQVEEIPEVTPYEYLSAKR